MKQEVSAGGIVYRVIKNDAVEWLICQHSQHKGWVFPKGLVGDTNKDEPVEEAALREVREEGGVKAQIVVPLTNLITYTYQWQGMLTHKTVHYFLMEYISGDPDDHDNEMDEAKFVSEVDVKKTLTYETDAVAFADALKIFKNM